MKLDEVPQDHSSTYGGYRKLVYAVDEKGHYQSACSDGWEAEAFATQLAVDELESLEQLAWQQFQQGAVSPLKALMYRYRLDEPALSMISGFWQWRIRRHFRPHIYRRLSAAQLNRYAEAFGMAVDELIRLQKELP